MFLGATLFLLIFILLAPQPRAILAGGAAAFATTMTTWAPFSYVFLAILIAAMLTGFWMLHTWPKHVEPESPMAKYRREGPLEED